MASAIHVGDQVRLPSGLKVSVTAPRAPTRPWAAVFMGRHWHVIRECAPAANCLGVEHYFAGGLAPLQLDESDAFALAAALNRAR